MTYSFCESTFATGRSPWHLRKLSSVGPKFGGGIDTPSLCGLVKVGWDLEVAITAHHLEHSCCPECRRVYKERCGDHSSP